jgi:AAA domain/REase_MTES_1575
LARRGFDSSMRIGAIGELIQTVKQGRRNLPLRTMLSNHWEVITQVAPLVLASPDSCVRFIDASKEPFDLVVFDEASQIRVATSIGALGRAKAAVVVGDSKQMPPTSVAQSKMVVDEEADDDMTMTADVESILALCEVARVPDIMLTWHFRSDDEALIAYSNHRYYDGKLNTFPGVQSKGTPTGLQYRPVSGQFIRSAQVKPGVILGTNPVEAKAIVDEIAKLLADPDTANDSIGVVTLNQQQSKYILDLLQTSENPLIAQAMETGINGQSLFVKNLETVQGSERDIILLSVAFSAKPEAKEDLPLQFGPIVNAGGHKRLNVAISRAKKQLIIFNSFAPSLLKSKNPVSKGLQDLAEFLLLASNSDRTEFLTISHQEEEIDLHRRDIMKSLTEAGLDVVEQVGLSEFKVDLAIRDAKSDGRLMLGILLDGDGWSSRKTVNDRDALPIELLTNRMGWPAILRVWLPAWLRDPQGETQRIVAAFNAARDTSKAPKAKIKAVKLEPIFEQKATTTDGSLRSAENPINRMLLDHKVWTAKQPRPEYASSNLDHLYDPKVQQVLVSLAEDLAEVEGPVSRERLAKYIGACFNLSRLVANRIDAINGIPHFSKNRDSEGFFYPKGESPKTYSSWQRATFNEPRKIEEISLQEIANAMASFAKVSQGIREDQLCKEVLTAFGVQRLTPSIQGRLDKALSHALKAQIITRNGDYLVA